ncbi:MAG TPA: peptide chain release factor N(5)-glutamine methyltransferase [Vicinamibacterales bacterium]|jgi:release factor glutamine methyltransferase
MSTIAERVASARLQLLAAGLSAAEADTSARVLAEHLLGWSRERFLADARSAEPAEFASHYAAAVARRAAREPLPYITGTREFWGLSLGVTPDVLIPRPETELIVEAALELFPERNAAFTMADVCTGSGCVAIAVAVERPHASIVATDISERALGIARLNAGRHDVASRIRLLRTDLLKSVGSEFDLIVANPPYVRAIDRAGLQPEVRVEPDVALFGGDDGLENIRRLIEQAPACMRPAAHLVFEFGFGQELDVERLISETPALTLLGLRRDLQGIARTAVARRR